MRINKRNTTETESGAGGAAAAAHRQRVQDLLLPDGTIVLVFSVFIFVAGKRVVSNPSPSDRSIFESILVSRLMVPSRITIYGSSTHLSFIMVTLLYTRMQITKTDKIKAMSKKQLRQIKKTQVRTRILWGERGTERERETDTQLYVRCTIHLFSIHPTAHSFQPNNPPLINPTDEPARRGGAGLAVGRPEAGRAAGAAEEALGQEGQEGQVLIPVFWGGREGDGCRRRVGVVVCGVWRYGWVNDGGTDTHSKCK